jgi:hypothetical protein
MGDNTTNSTVDELIGLLKRAGEKALFQPEGIDTFNTSLKGAADSADDVTAAHANASRRGTVFTQSLISNTKGLGKFHDSVRASAEATNLLKNQVAHAQQEFDNLYGTLSEGQRTEKRKNIEILKRQHEDAQARHEQMQKSGETSEAAGKSLRSLVGTLYHSIMTTTDTLLSSTDSLGTTITALKAGIDVAGKTVGFAADLAKMFTGVNMAGKIAEFGLDALGDAAEIGGEVLKDIIDLLGKEVAKTINAYQKMSSVGSVFAGGMEEMRATSQEAQMGLEEFNRITVDNAKELAQSGLGITDAAKRFAGISKTMSESGLREQISNLGYTFEEFGGLTADIMSRLGTSGQLNLKSDKEIGELTVEYAKNLRLISAVTGEDARKKMEESRKTALKAGIYEKVLQLGGPEALKKFQAQMELVPEELKQGALEFVASGGTAVRHAGTNIAMQQVSGIKDVFSGLLGSLTDPAMSAEEAQLQMLKNMQNIGKQLNESNSTIGAMGFSNIFGAGGDLAEATTIFSNLRAVTGKMPANIEDLREQVNKMATTPGKFTENISGMTEKIQASKAAAEKLATEALPAFSTALHNTAGALDKVTQKLKDLLTPSTNSTATATATATTKQQVFQQARQTTTRQAAAATTPGFTEFPSWEPGPVPESSDKKPATGKPVEKLALGGITDGISIAGERGPEAVVPLPDGRTIPVEIRSTQAVYGDMVNPSSRSAKDSPHDMETFLQNQLKAMQNSASILENILTVLRDSYDTQDRMLANSY